MYLSVPFVSPGKVENNYNKHFRWGWMLIWDAFFFLIYLLKSTVFMRQS